MIKDLTQIICKYREIVVSLHRKVKIANTLYRGYAVPFWYKPDDGQTYARICGCLLKFLEYGHKKVCSGNFRK